MANGIRTGVPRGFNKGHSLKFCEGSRVRQTPEEGCGNVVEIAIKMKTIVRKPLMIKKITKTPEEGWGTYRPKRCGNNYKDSGRGILQSNSLKGCHYRRDKERILLGK